MIFQKDVVIKNFFTFPQAIIKATFENENPSIIKLNSVLAIVS
jgi:hypothetical protein